MRLIKHKNEDTNSSFRIVSVYDMLRFYLDKLIQTLDELPDVINHSISNDTITRREMIVFLYSRIAICEFFIWFKSLSNASCENN